MILIPEQISYLRKQIKVSKENIRSYNDYLSSKDITSGDYSARAFIGDTVLDNQYDLERKRYRDTMYALENADYKKERSTICPPFKQYFLIIGQPINTIFFKIPFTF